jgi:hypothetical protein
MQFYEAPDCEILPVAVERAFVSDIPSQTESYGYENVDPDFE